LIWTKDAREARRWNVSGSGQREPAERDRDAVLYSSAFHRLAGITQIVRAGEADYFHTRQQHSLKVAQLGRRLAQACIKKQPILADAWGIDPEVVEAACLAHDLGHPPFGHIGEKTLNELVNAAGDADGYEGNAQTFRILTKTGVRYDETNGLDMTRATLAAVLKYPWPREVGHPAKDKKWSAYRSEKIDFEFARKFHQHERQSAEAALMDWADDIAYSVHDIEDFHRAGAMPWRLIFEAENARPLVDATAEKWFGKPADASDRLMQAWSNLGDYFAGYEAIMREPYDGCRAHRVALRTLTSTLIGRYVQATKLSEDFNADPIIRGTEEEAEILILKQITKQYIIKSPTLLAQQHGQRRIIRKLFKAIMDGAGTEFPDFLPVRLAYLWDLREGSTARFAADCIASMTEAQALALFGRLSGTAAGSVLDPIIK